MIQEQKDLLLKDLSARLPYGVKFLRKSWNYEWDQELSVIEVLEDIDKNGYINNRKIYNVEDIKPYLFPLSSMTEEQSLELEIITGETIGFDAYSLHDFTGYSEISLSKTFEIIQWCYTNHFDINGLIPMGLANDATNLNIY
jgi:hypothetical protein